jgi:hypothetical protein
MAKNWIRWKIEGESQYGWLVGAITALAVVGVLICELGRALATWLR